MKTDPFAEFAEVEATLQADLLGDKIGFKAIALARKAKRKETRRAASEARLAEILPTPLEENTSYHVLSSGDVDSLSYLALILRNETLEYLLFSTWCMAMQDCNQFRFWVESKKIKRLDGYVGEIFASQYPDEYVEMLDVCKATGGRLAVFRNHSKIFAGVCTSGMHFAVESSANINTNPRTEQGAIHCDKTLFNFYKSYFDGIQPFNRQEVMGWRPW